MSSIAPAPDVKFDPDTKSNDGSAATPTTSAAGPSPAATSQNNKSNMKRKGTGKRFLSAYAQTWIGMTPLWLMGEALIPGAKVGGTFKSGGKKMFGVAEELRDALMTDSEDVVVILDKHFNLGGLAKAAGGSKSKADANVKDSKDTGKHAFNFDEQSRRAAEVIRAAGESAIVAVSSSLQGAQSQVHGSSPQIKKVVAKHGKDVVVLVDKALKNPIVITGVSRFAKSKGIPYSEGLLRLASMGLAKIIAAIPDDIEEQVEAEIRQDAADKRKHEVPGKRWEVEELDAEELERSSTSEAKEEANSAGKLGGPGSPKVEGDKVQHPTKRDSCIIC